MKIYEIHDAKAKLLQLVDQAAKGKPFVIAQAGKPMVKVIAVKAPEPSPIKRFGFLAGQISVPDDFDVMGSADIEKMFSGGR